MKYIILLIIFIVGGLFLFSRLQTQKQRTNDSSLIQEQTSLSPQSSSEGSVTVEITPKDISASATLWQFKVVLNTHTDELVADLTKVVILKDKDGTIYEPLSWDGDPPGGHHREGVLSFRPITPTPISMVFLMKDIGGIKERNFSWEIAR